MVLTQRRLIQKIEKRLIEPVSRIARSQIVPQVLASRGEGQILQLLGVRAAGPLETLFNSGRPPQETIPEVVQGARDSADGAIKAARQQVEQAIPVMVLDELKPTVRKLGMLNDEGLKHLDVYLNFLISQGFIKK